MVNRVHKTQGNEQDKTLKSPAAISRTATQRTNNGRTHYENMPIQIHWKVWHQKMIFFSDKNSDILHICAQK